MREPVGPRHRWHAELRQRLAPLRLSPEREAEIVDELSDHLDAHREELIAGGATEEDATRLALADFRSGNVLARYMAPLKQSNMRPAPIPGATTGRVWKDLSQDLRYAVRVFARQPGFAVTAILTLALGIGANSALFSVVHGVLLESLPFKDADRLYRLRMVYPDGAAYTTLSPPDFMSVREGTRVFDQVEAYTTGAVTMLGGGDPREVRASSVSDGLFRLLAMPMAAGREFVREEHAPGRNRVAILDYGFWQRAFGGDRAAVGRSVVVGGISYSIAGVLAQGARLPADVPGARVPSEADLYLPLEYGETFSAVATQRNSRYLAVLGRARQGVGSEAVDEDLQRLAREIKDAFPGATETQTMNAVSARELIVGDVRRPLMMLLGAVGFVLLVACANVASLMLARASARQEELTVRAALGAARGRLVRQLLTEALVLAAAGGAAGLALAYAGTQALVRANPTDIPRLAEIGVDRTVVMFTIGIALVASLAFGTLPALQATGSLTAGLRTGGRGGGADRRSQRLRAALVIAEIALAVVLLTGAGLMLRSLMSLQDVAPGFVSDRTVAFRMALYGRGYDLARVRSRVAEIEEELRKLPGVTAVGSTSLLPMSGPGPRLTFGVDGVPAPPGVNPEIGVASVTPQYFATIGARLVAGRGFSDDDRVDAAPVAIINEAAARRWFAGADPIGRRVHMAGVRQVVGVIGDVLQGNPTQPVAPQLFVPYAQRPVRSVSFTIRIWGEPSGLASSIRSLVRRLDAELAPSEMTELHTLRNGSLARPRFYAGLLALFASVALALAVTGVFGVMSYAVAERTREIAIRIALGARSHDVLWMIVGRSVALALVGVVAGIATALAVGPVIRNQLFGVHLMDPATLAAVVVLLLFSATIASLVPARRAARLDDGDSLHPWRRQLLQPADIGSRDEMPRWPHDMSPQDPASVERALHVSLRPAITHAQRQRPRRRLELLRLHRTQPRHNILGTAKTSRRQHLVP